MPGSFVNEEYSLLVDNKCMINLYSTCKSINIINDAYGSSKAVSAAHEMKEK